jgi:hypothetical protein
MQRRFYWQSGPDASAPLGKRWRSEDWIYKLTEQVRCPHRARSVKPVFSLRALAARKMRPVHDHPRCNAEEKPAIHGRRSETISAELQVADTAASCCVFSKVGLLCKAT